MAQEKQMKVPSLQESEEVTPAVNDNEESKHAVASVARKVAWLGFPIVAYLAWVTFPVIFVFTSWIFSLFIMIIGFIITRRIIKALRKYSTPQPKLPPPLTIAQRFDNVCMTIENAGFRKAAGDARALYRLSKTFAKEHQTFLSVIDDGLQLHLGFLLKLALMMGEEQEGKIKNKDAVKNRPFPKIEIGDGDGFTGIRIGDSILIGEDQEFEGIRIGNLRIGERKKKFPKQMRRDKDFKVTDPHVVDAEFVETEGKKPQQDIPMLPAPLSGFQEAATRATVEISHLRTECENLVMQNAQGDYEREASYLRQRLQTERKIAEELAGISRPPQK